MIIHTLTSDPEVARMLGWRLKRREVLARQRATLSWWRRVLAFLGSRL